MNASEIEPWDPGSPEYDRYILECRKFKDVAGIEIGAVINSRFVSTNHAFGVLVEFFEHGGDPEGLAHALHGMDMDFSVPMDNYFTEFQVICRFESIRRKSTPVDRLSVGRLRKRLRQHR